MPRILTKGMFKKIEKNQPTDPIFLAKSPNHDFLGLSKNRGT